MNNTSVPPKKFALVSEVKAGDLLIPDAGFDCLTEGKAKLVLNDNLHGLYIKCSHDEHFLSGQISNDGREYIGLYKLDDRRKTGRRQIPGDPAAARRSGKDRRQP